MGICQKRASAMHLLMANGVTTVDMGGDAEELTVERGKPADLLFSKATPLQDIRNTSGITAELSAAEVKADNWD